MPHVPTRSQNLCFENSMVFSKGAIFNTFKFLCTFKNKVKLNAIILLFRHNCLWKISPAFCISHPESKQRYLTIVCTFSKSYSIVYRFFPSSVILHHTQSKLNTINWERKLFPCLWYCHIKILASYFFINYNRKILNFCSPIHHHLLLLVSPVEEVPHRNSSIFQPWSLLASTNKTKNN